MGAAIINKATSVPSINGISIEVNPGDLWDAPYRGSKYSVRRLADLDGKERYRLVWARKDKLVHTSVPKGLIPLLRESRPSITGGIRITSHREVLCKRPNKNTGKWDPHYIGILEGDIDFTDSGFDLNPNELSTGRFWRGFHFKHGETWAVWTRGGNEDYLYWSKKGVYFKSTVPYLELCKLIREIRPKGGRIYITDHGHIWFNLNDAGLSYKYRDEIQREMLDDIELFKNDKQYDTLIQSISERIDATKLRPLYLGKMEDFGEPPRTYFETPFSEGTKLEDEDDEDGDHSKGYRRMRR